LTFEWFVVCKIANIFLKSGDVMAFITQKSLRKAQSVLAQA